MKDISLHVDEFVKRMTEQGYTGSFQCNGLYPGKLKECLVSALLMLLDKRKDLKPFVLTMVPAKRKKDEPAFTLLYQFDVSYERDHGFRIVRITVTDQAVPAEVAVPELYIRGGTRIPDRQHIARLFAADHTSNTIHTNQKHESHKHHPAVADERIAPGTADTHAKRQ